MTETEGRGGRGEMEGKEREADKTERSGKKRGDSHLEPSGGPTAHMEWMRVCLSLSLSHLFNNHTRHPVELV